MEQFQFTRVALAIGAFFGLAYITVWALTAVGGDWYRLRADQPLPPS